MVNKESLKRKSIYSWMILTLSAILMLCFPALSGKVQAAGEAKDYVVLTIEKMDQDGNCSFIQEPVRVPFSSLESRTPEELVKVGTGNPEGIKTTGPHWGQKPIWCE